MEKTELIIILDRSGSMYDLKEDTIGGYNSLIEEQKKLGGDAVVTTVMFNNHYDVIHDKVDLKEVQPLTEADYIPRGTTALLDAVGKALTSQDHEKKVLVTIVTDGYENASKEYNWGTIKKIIEDKRKEGWIFTFIGADIDEKQVSADMGIDPKFSRKYTKSTAGTSSVYKAISNSMKAVRLKASDEDVSDEVFTALDEIK